MGSIGYGTFVDNDFKCLRQITFLQGQNIYSMADYNEDLGPK